MAISKIILNGITQIDLTQDTVSQANHILSPYVGHLNDGTQVTGTGSGSRATYETYFDGSITAASDKTISIPSLSSLYFASGETWRVTWDGTEYTCSTNIHEGWLWYIGNHGLIDGTDDGTGEPFCLYNYGGGALNGMARTAGTHTLKLEKQTSSGGGGGVITETVMDATITATDQDTSGYVAWVKTQQHDYMSETLVDDTNYIVTIDGTPYLCHANAVYGGGDIYCGDTEIVWGTPANSIYPFAIGSYISGNVQWMIGDTQPHSVKVEKVISMSDSATLITKTITLNGSYSAEDDQADGYSEVTVNVQGGASMTEVQNTYGTELVVTSAEGSTPSATRHTLYFEYEDETTETVYAYYDDALIGSAITATTPTTHNNKTVTSAQLDGVEWYSYTPEPTPSGNWTTLYDGQITAYDSEATIPSLADVYFAEGETYRVTIDGTEYVRETAYFDGQQSLWVVGNPNMISREPEASEDQFCVFNAGWGALYVVLPGSVSADHTFKLEKQGG